MKTTLVCLLVFIGSQAFMAASDWHTFENDNISIEFPKKPTLSKQSVPTAMGNIEIDIASYETFGENSIAYVLMSKIYPDSLIASIKKEDLSVFYRNHLESSAKKINGRLISEKKVTLNGYPGREARIDSEDGTIVFYLHMYLVRNTLHLIQTVMDKGKEDDKTSLRFHRSFKLKK